MPNLAPVVSSATVSGGCLQRRSHPIQRVASRRLAICRSQGDGEASSSDIPDSMPFAGTGADWREFRAKLVQQERVLRESESATLSTSPARLTSDDRSGMWAHAVPGPEQGCLLVAHPLMFLSSQTYFSQSVIFIFGHGETGSVGLILNKPTQFKLGGVQGAEVLCPEFAEEPLNLGGDVGRDTLHVLHPYPEIEGAQMVLNGVCVGGFKGAKDAVRSKGPNPENFRWFTRYAGWAPGQLENECKQGVWFTAAAGKDVILQAVSGTGQDMWHQVLELMGGEYAELSASVRASYVGGEAGSDRKRDEDREEK